MIRSTALLLSALLAASAPVAAHAAALPVKLRVMSYNMHSGRGPDGRLDLDRTAAVIRSAGVDVVGLQEVDVHWSRRSAWRDQVHALAAELHMRAYFAPIHNLAPPEPGAPRRRYGLAVLSDHPVVRAENHWLTRRSTNAPQAQPVTRPGFPEVVVDVRGVFVHVYAAHLDHRPDPSIRRVQVQEILRVLSEDGQNAEQVLVGDFNAPPGAAELAPIWDRLDDAAAARPPAAATYPAESPRTRIDYLTHSPGIGVESVRVPSTQASDHLPVVAELLLPRAGSDTPGT